MVTDGVNGMLQSNYGTGGSEGGYGLNPAAFAAYSNHAGYPGNMGASGQEMYAANAMYSQGFVTASQVINQQTRGFVFLLRKPARQKTGYNCLALSSDSRHLM